MARRQDGLPSRNTVAVSEGGEWASAPELTFRLYLTTRGEGMSDGAGISGPQT